MATRIPKYLQNLLNTGERSDFSIFVLDREGNKIEKKVHTLVIRQCRYFAAMLDLNGTEAKNRSVTIDNIANEVFDYALRYIYTDDLGDMPVEQVGKVAEAADYLQLEDLKMAALDRWKDSLWNFEEKKDVIEAFRALIALSLNIKPDKSWRKALEILLIAIYDLDTDFDIAKESSAFIEFFVDSFGVSHPSLTAHALAEWASAVDLNLIKEQLDERKELAAELLKRIKLNPLSLHALAILSKTEAFPISYMITQMQQRAEARDLQACDKVEYTLSMKHGRIVELEFEASFVLFRFIGLEEDNKQGVWEFLHVPEKCKTLVKLCHPIEDDKSWPAKSKRGTLPLGLKHYQFESKEFRFFVTLTLEDGRKDRKYQYSNVYD